MLLGSSGWDHGAGCSGRSSSTGRLIGIEDVQFRNWRLSRDLLRDSSVVIGRYYPGTSMVDG